MVHINDVANGLACGCVCPGCDDRMVAKQGAITNHHCAHEGGSDCAGELQTTLHLAAKAVQLKERRMVLPALAFLLGVGLMKTWLLSLSKDMVWKLLGKGPPPLLMGQHNHQFLRHWIPRVARDAPHKASSAAGGRLLLLQQFERHGFR